MKTSKTQITKLITNALIIGKTYQSGNIIHIEKPYACYPTPEGLQMQPFDKEILGKDLDIISIDNKNVVYSTEPSQDIINTYLKAISGIETEVAKTLIL